MNKTLILSLLIPLNSFAQFSSSPFGASSAPIPPIGENKKSNCGVGRCSFEVNIKPYCFAANLRSYGVDRQLKAKHDVEMEMKLTSASDSKKVDNVKIVFPASLTFASDGIKINCDVVPGQDMKKEGEKDITCKKPESDEVSTYKVKDWKYVSGDLAYNYYMSRNMHAYKTSGSLDQDIVCYYKFDGNNRSSNLVTSSVACYFPSTLPDLSSKIKVYKENTLLSNVKVEATINKIKVIFDDGFNSIAQKLPVKHGQVDIGVPPKHLVNYTQPEVNTVVAAVKESESFDEANAYKTFSTQVKFVSENGFCGGFYSPLMFFFSKNLPRFVGVSGFKLYGNKDGTRVHWPESDVESYFLSLPKKNKVQSYKELFGETEVFANGFEALKIYDKNKDSVIDQKDSIFGKLRLWRDINSDGISDPEELFSLKAKGVTSINLKYNSKEITRFEERARAREKSKFSYVENGEEKSGDVFDIWLSAID